MGFLDTAYGIAAILGGTAGAVTVAGAAMTPLYRRRRARRRADEESQRRFLADWHGTPGRPGFPEIPGVPARLETVERSVSSMGQQLQDIHAELHPNHGTSLADKVQRIDLTVKALSEKLDAQEANDGR